ncbi:MAG: 50S ribosomal protein L9 [Chloroflexi bacterium]|nr:50S ribosomal protein L9 [Chloroflexota bacterium]
MKVIFLEDVPKVGKAGQTKEVANGYGRNYLIPKKLAMPATAEASRLVQAQIKARALIQAQTEAEMMALARELEGREIIVKARAGADDKLYGSVTNADIAAALDSAGYAVDKRKVELEEPIRQLGAHEVEVKLSKDLSPRIKVVVEREGE